MNRYIFFLIWLFMLAGLSGAAQPKSANSSVFLFADRDYCISGDTVWFKTEIRNGWQNESNVVHVQLDSGDNRFITDVKKKSSGNWAEGFIHVPDSLSTGVYFLTAFLNTQRSQSPFQSLKKSLFVYNRFDEEITEMQVPELGNRTEEVNYGIRIPIKTDKNIYSQGEKVTVEIDLTRIDTSDAKQVVIRATHVEETAQQFGGRFLEETVPPKSSVPFIEEKDGFLLSGTVTEVASGQPAGNVVVLLSLFGEMPYLDYYLTDSNGNFHFFLKDAYGVANIVLQAVGEMDREFNIRINKNYLATDALTFQRQILTPEQSNAIANVIDGVFFKKLFADSYSVESETFFMPARFSVPFYGPPYERIVPAEFFDLPDFREIARELLHGVQYRVNNGEIIIRLLNQPQKIYFKSDPLRLINGIPVFKNQILSRFNSTDIEYIDYVLKERLYGDLNFKGVLSISLNDKSNSWLTTQPNFFRISVPCLQPDKQPGYHRTPIQKKNLPDIRQINFWQLTETGKNQQVEFYLSDLKGKIEISVEGATSDNSIFKSSKIIEVK